MNIKKVIHAGGSRGNEGAVLISSWTCNYSLYLDIQVYYLDIYVISTLYAFYWFLMCWFLLLIHFSIIELLSWKVTFSGTEMESLLQEFWIYKDGTRFILKRN